MPNWKKVIVSGSNAILSNITASGDISASGDIHATNFIGTILSSSVSEQVTVSAVNTPGSFPVIFATTPASSDKYHNLFKDTSVSDFYYTPSTSTLGVTNLIGTASHATFAENGIENLNILGNTDGQIITATGLSSTLQGESNLTFNAGTLTVTGKVAVNPQGATGFFEVASNPGGGYTIIGDQNNNNNSTIFKVDDENSNITFKFQENNPHTHTFTHGGLNVQGAITASGDISASGNLYAANFNGDGSGLTGVGTVDTSGTPAANQIAIFTDSDTIKGSSQFTFNTATTAFAVGDALRVNPSDNVVFNNGNDDQGFQVKGSSDDNLLRVNPTNSDKIGIGTATPGEKLEVIGNISASGTITAGGATFTGNLTVTGSQLITDDITSDGTIRARVKSFDIPHPTRKNKRLVYGVIEGPEHGIYCRGESKELKVLLPPEWRAMVDKKGISVQITPIGEWQPLYFKKLHSNWLYFGCGDDREEVHFYWEIKGERTDVPKLQTVQ